MDSRLRHIICLLDEPQASSLRPRLSLFCVGLPSGLTFTFSSAFLFSSPLTLTTSWYPSNPWHNERAALAPCKYCVPRTEVSSLPLSFGRLWIVSSLPLYVLQSSLDCLLPATICLAVVSGLALVSISTFVILSF